MGLHHTATVCDRASRRVDNSTDSCYVNTAGEASPAGRAVTPVSYADSQRYVNNGTAAVAPSWSPSPSETGRESVHFRAPPPGLDSYTESRSGGIGETARRRESFELLRLARKTLPFTRIADCLYGFRSGEVAVVQRVDGRAGYAGFHRCGSRWACPVCSRRAAAADFARSQRVFQAALDAGHCLFQATFTMRHQAGVPLARSIAVMRKAQQLMHAGRGWQAIKQRFHLGERSYGPEATYGRNGWHWHRHGVYEGLKHPKLRTRRQRKVYAKKMEDALTDRWLACLAKAGGPDFVGERGIAVRVHVVAGDGEDAEATARYLTKYAMETTQRVAKFGRKGSRTPWQLLRDGWDQRIDQRQRFGLRTLFREYVAATHGVHGIWMSKGWAAAAPEPTPAELQADDVGQRVIEVADPYVRILRGEGLQCELLERTERDGPDEARRWLHALRWDGLNTRYSRYFEQSEDRGPSPDGRLVDVTFGEEPWTGPPRRSRPRPPPSSYEPDDF